MISFGRASRPSHVTCRIRHPRLVSVLLTTWLLGSYPFQPQSAIKLLFSGLLLGTVGSILYVGTLISLGGDWFLTVALLDLVLQLTGSATLASLMLLCQSLPIFIFTPIAGRAPRGSAAPG